jgi:hypothetical protein
MMPTVSVNDFRHPLDVKLERPAATKQALDARRPPVQPHDEIG